MFTVHLDISLNFHPPMERDAGGVLLHRTLELPFAPSLGLRLAGRAIEGQAAAQGYVIEGLTWDLDRQAFVAETRVNLVDVPLAEIPFAIHDWLARGWQLGSSTEPSDATNEPHKTSPEALAMCGYDPADAEALRWPTMDPPSRPASFNHFLKALVREMTRQPVDWPVAYAIDQTGLFFTEEQQAEFELPGVGEFIEAVRTFTGMPFEERLGWKERVMLENPRLGGILVAMQGEAG